MDLKEALLVYEYMSDPRKCVYEDCGKKTHLTKDDRCVFCGKTKKEIEDMSFVYDRAVRKIKFLGIEDY